MVVAAPGAGPPMTATTYVWGTVADEYGLCHWRRHEGSTSPDGRFVAQRFDEWSSEPSDAYAVSHPAPLPAKWCHGDDLGRVVALRRMDGKLRAVAELDEVTPADLANLADEYGALRWSASTRQQRGGPLTITECSLTPQPASVGLAAVSWHRHGESKGNMPAWVAADIKRGRADMNRRRDTLEVYERAGHWLATEQEAADAHIRHADDRYRHDPREIHFGAAGRILAVGGRPLRG